MGKDLAPVRQQYDDFISLTDRDPYPFYDASRERAPLVWDDSISAWLVTSYTACRYIEMREDLFRHPYANPIPNLREIKGGDTISVIQGVRHPLMHRFLLGLFTPRLVKNYCEIHISPIAHELITRFSNRDSIEMASEYADLIPPRVILALLGIPWRDDIFVRQIVNLHHSINQWISRLNLPGIEAQALAASSELNAILLPFIRARRDTPQNDLISRVWTEWPNVLGEITELEVLAISRELFLAGTEATAHAIANAIHILATDPNLIALVRSGGKGTLNTFVDESLRLFSPVQHRFRVANQDSEIEGIKVATDQHLALINAAANRDPSHYQAANQIDLERKMPRDQLTFNVGPRTCVGAALARAEIIEATKALLERTERLHPDPSAPPPVFTGHFSRSFRPIYLNLRY